jgi:molybdate transport system regulatory protein
MRVVYRMWLDNNGLAFGEYVYLLLKGIEKTGSLSRAAAAMGTACGYARRVILCCERNLGFALISRTIGGMSGGGSRLTPKAIDMMKKYEEARAHVENALSKAYQTHFGEQADVFRDVRPGMRKRIRRAS